MAGSINRSRKYTAEEAAEIIEKAGFRPKEPYPGRTRDRWRVKCKSCKKICIITLSHVKDSGRVCGHRRRRRVFRPLSRADLPQMKLRYDAGATLQDVADEFGGSPTSVRVMLVEVTTMRRPRGWYSSSRRNARRRRDPVEITGRNGSRSRNGYWYTDDEANALVDKAGYTPEDPYPGNVGASWRVRCKSCGQLRRVRLQDILRGLRCAHWRPYSKVLPPEARTKYEEGSSLQDLAEEYGMSSSTVKKQLSRVTTIRSSGGDMQSAGAVARRRRGQLPVPVEVPANTP